MHQAQQGTKRGPAQEEMKHFFLSFCFFIFLPICWLVKGILVMVKDPIVWNTNPAVDTGGLDYAFIKAKHSSL
jgi:hypothetical protein